MSDEVLELQPETSAVRVARRWVLQRLTDLGMTDVGDVAVLLTSELVTNVVLHAGTPMELSVRLDGPGVRVEVADHDAAPVRRLNYGVAATTGRGSLLLDRLATRWGSRPCDDGKVTWFALEPDEHAAIPGDGDGSSATG